MIDLKKLPVEKIKKFMPAVAFFSGFTWDSLTLTRIDRAIDNLILFVYLMLLGGLIILTVLIERAKIDKPPLLRFKKWYPFGMQFLLGGLFSAYVVFYFHSSSMAQPSLFLIILAGLLVANEFLEKKLTEMYLQVALYSMVNFSFFIFFVPVIFRHIGFLSFLAAGIIGMAFVEGMVYFFKRNNVFQTAKEFKYCRAIPPVLFGLLTIFYLMNWIPPVPLSLKYAGIYHNVKKEITDSGSLQYTLSFEKPPWYKPWKNADDTFHYKEGDRVYCFTAVFASTDLKTAVYHHWLWYDEGKEEWLTTDKLKLDMSGGRNEGYRLPTYKERIRPGEWRVDVKSESDALLGRVEFEIEPAEDKVYELKSIVR